MGAECFARCGYCEHVWPIGCVVPCPLPVFIAAAKAAQCPQCGERKAVYLYEPGIRPPEAPRQ